MAVDCGTMPLSMSPEILHGRLQTALNEFSPGHELGNVTPLKGGVSAQMWAFDSSSPDGELGKFVARIPGQHIQQKEGGIETEFRNLRAVNQAGLLAPQEHYLEEPSEEGHDRLYVMSHINGLADLGPVVPSSYLAQFALALASVHRLDLTEHGLTDVRRFKNAWTPRREKVDDGLREPDIRAALEELGPQTGSNPSVLRHGDMWPGNVLWRDGLLVGVVDWENMSLGDPIEDLSVSRLDLLWILGWDAMVEFTHHYLSYNPVDTSLLPYYDLVASLRPVSTLETWAPAYTHFGRPDITVEILAEAHGVFVDAALRSL